MNRTSRLQALRDSAISSLKISTKINQDNEEKAEKEREATKEDGIFYIKNNFTDYYIEKEILGEGCMGLVRRVVRIADNQ